MSDETTLLPCPFCKGEAETFNPFDNADGTWCVLCSECAAATCFEQTEANAIAVWNTRAPVEYEGWFYLPKPKNSLVHYGTPQIEKTENGYKAKQPVEVIESAIRAWGDELGEHIMKRICEVWNTRATHGTLTAEQVRECVQHVYHEGYSDGSVRRGAHIGETDWQAIADELNAELGSGTCEMEYIDTYEYPDGDEDYLCKCSKCGRKSWEPAHNLPKFCGGCGKAVDR